MEGERWSGLMDYIVTYSLPFHLVLLQPSHPMYFSLILSPHPPHSHTLSLTPIPFSSSQDPSVKDDILLEVINLCGTFSLDEKCAALLVQARLPDLLVTLLKGTHVSHTLNPPPLTPSSPHTLPSHPPLTPSPPYPSPFPPHPLPLAYLA